MLTFKQIQDLVLLQPTGRFNANYRAAAKEWINYVLSDIWGLEAWTFKQASALLTVTTGSTSVTNLPGDVGIIRQLLNAQGAKLTFRQWDEFNLRHYGDSGTAQPWDFTTIGTGTGCAMYVGPPSSETSSLYQLLYERERGFYPSTTLTGTPTLPTASIGVATTSGAATAGTALIGGRLVTYTGLSGGNTLTGCTGGTGTFVAGDVCVFLNPQAGELYNDTDVPMLPPDRHQILVHAATAIGQTGENDYSLYLSDDRVQKGLQSMSARYLISERGETQQWGSYDHAHFETGGSW